GLVPNLPAEAQPLPSRALLDKSVDIPAFEIIQAASQPQRVSEGVLLGSAVTRVLPEYPRFAKELHLTGEVKVEVTIDVDGHVVEVQSISGPNPLRPAAEEAARKWVFNPTLLNKVPVRVRGNLTFIFKKP
ncbi:MAG: energy transducer TonB, partial [Blastocatellia bacterium]|nr:energy transducer TonB [Blastocatellia bacterium]